MLRRKNIPLKPEDEFSDLGIGSKASSQRKRMLNRDGSFNVERRGLPFFSSLSLYHSLLNISWLKFNFLVILSFAAINIFFALLYMFTGFENLRGLASSTIFGKFLEAFFFSTQTFTTVGYGGISPGGTWSNIIASIESLTGLMGFALATGLVYGRFSNPNAKIIYSRKAVIAPYKNFNAFMFRLANARKNQLIEVEIQVILSLNEETDGVVKRNFHDLKLERQKVNFFPLSWTVVHPITEESPLQNINYNVLIDSNAEFIVLLKAYDDKFSQTVHSRTSYKFDEIVWGAKFKNIFVEPKNEITAIDLGKIHDFEETKLN